MHGSITAGLEANRWHQLVRIAPSGTSGLAIALLLLTFASSASAASIYKCVATNGSLSFRDTPCVTHARQTKLDLKGLPLIDPGAPRHRRSQRARTASRRARSRHPRAHARRHTLPMSWECRAADGEVFYRHTRCPGSVPGDGVVRMRDAETLSGSRTRRTAWSRVRVHGIKIPRAEACRRIHSAGAAVRDGHLRDAHVSTYDRLMGRGPCAGT
jgi:hypothetical protein